MGQSGPKKKRPCSDDSFLEEEEGDHNKENGSGNSSDWSPVSPETIRISPPEIHFRHCSSLRDHAAVPSSVSSSVPEASPLPSTAGPSSSADFVSSSSDFANPHADFAADFASNNGPDESEWQREHEVIAFQWKTVCDERAKAHVQTAVLMKILYHLMSFPVYTVPLIVTQMEKFDAERGEWTSVLKYLLTVNAVLAGLNTAANFGKRSEQHFNLESQFSRLGKVIGVMMETPKKDRQRPQNFLVTSAYQMESLFAISPNLACAQLATRCISALMFVRRCFKCRCKRTRTRR
jgi:hypothetical protein